MVKLREANQRRMTTRAPTIAPAKPMPSRMRPVVRPAAVWDAENQKFPDSRAAGGAGRATVCLLLESGFNLLAPAVIDDLKRTWNS